MLKKRVFLFEKLTCYQNLKKINKKMYNKILTNTA
jgi:hypothetical protein